MNPDWTGALEQARAHAPFLARALDRLPELEALLAAGQGEAALDLARQAGTDAPSLGAALRRERLAIALTLAIGDLAGAFPLARVTGGAVSAAEPASARSFASGAMPKGFPQGAIFAEKSGGASRGWRQVSGLLGPWFPLLNPGTFNRRGDVTLCRMPRFRYPHRTGPNVRTAQR